MYHLKTLMFNAIFNFQFRVQVKLYSGSAVSCYMGVLNSQHFLVHFEAMGAFRLESPAVTQSTPPPSPKLFPMLVSHGLIISFPLKLHPFNSVPHPERVFPVSETMVVGSPQSCKKLHTP